MPRVSSGDRDWHLNSVTDGFEAALETQDDLAIKQAAAVLDSFLRGFFQEEREPRPQSSEET